MVTAVSLKSTPVPAPILAVDDDLAHRQSSRRYPTSLLKRSAISCIHSRIREQAD